MGEFGSGGFVGAALIAQAVKNAMCFDGYTSVAQVIENVSTQVALMSAQTKHANRQFDLFLTKTTTLFSTALCICTIPILCRALSTKAKTTYSLISR